MFSINFLLNKPHPTSFNTARQAKSPVLQLQQSMTQHIFKNCQIAKNSKGFFTSYFLDISIIILEELALKLMRVFKSFKEIGIFLIIKNDRLLFMVISIYWLTNTQSLRRICKSRAVSFFFITCLIRPFTYQK